MVQEINMSKRSETLNVSVSPIKTSLRGEPIKNSWAMKIQYPDGSINVIYHIVGMFHIVTDI